MSIEEYVWITASDGVRLSGKLYRPADSQTNPVPVLIEALPYRKDDITSHYGSEYRRLRDEGGYGVLRVDVRGTGSSEGVAEDEYTEREQQDWLEMFDWLVEQPWCDGNLGMYGTSYSGFNALQMAWHAHPALKAIISIYATDSRFTDDVHYGGGAQRGIDLADYPLYMVAMNMMPPAPHVYGEGWREEWERRLEHNDPWVLRWMEEQTESDYWLQGSIKTDYTKLTAATMIIAGWADGYHNMAFRTLEQMSPDTPTHLLAGPWAHMSFESSTPGPRIDIIPDMLAWWDLHLKGDTGGAAASWPQVRAYMRRPTVPEPDLEFHEGEWWGEPVWPVPRAERRSLDLGSGSDEYTIRGDVGFYGSIWCAGSLPWGPPMDQREDDALSLTYEWPVDEEIAILGHPVFRAAVRSSVPVTYLSAKLCNVMPDGTSCLVSRGILNLTHRDSASDPKPLVPGELYEIDLELDATGWIFEPGHTIRLSVSTSDWPSSWSPPLPGTITIERDESSLSLPVLDGPPGTPTPSFTEPSGESIRGEIENTPHEVDWIEQHDVLRRTRAIIVDYGYPVSEDDPFQQQDHEHMQLTVSTVDPGRSSSHGEASAQIIWPEVKFNSHTKMSVESDAETYTVHLEIDILENDEPKVHREWDRVIPRNLQ